MLNLQNFQGGKLDEIEHNTQGKCICQACTCGKHHCPSPKKKGDFHSSYADQYKKFDITASRARKVQQPLPQTHYDPDIQSSYTANFKQADPEEYSKSRQNNRLNMIKKNYIMPNDGFYGTSSYGAQYSGKMAPRPQKFIMPNNLKTSDDRFQGQSTYNSNFIPGQTQRTKPVQRPPSNTGLGKGKFEGGSSYVADYQGKNQARQQKFIQKNQLQLSNSPFNGSSSYGTDYANKGNGMRAQRAPQIKNHVMPQGRFQGDSSYNANYVPSKLEKNPQFRPQGELKIGGNWQGSSSYGADYANRGNGVRAQRAPQIKNQVMPQGRFDGDSTYHGHYVSGKIQKNPQFKPKGQLQIGGRWQGSTSYGADYANKGSPIRAQKAPQIKNQIMPQGRFEGDSSYNANFVPNKAQKNPQFRPLGQLKIGGNWQGVSSYGADYDNKGNGVRAQRAPQIKNHVMPQGRFQGDSTYQGTYIPGAIQKNPQFKPKGQLQIGGKWQGASSYGADYANRGNGQRAERAPQVKNQIMPQGRFNGDSTYNGHYIPGKLEPNPQFRPKGQLQIGGKWEGNSSYGNDYKMQSPQRKHLCPTQLLKAPRYQVSDHQHIRYNSNKHQWE